MHRLVLATALAAAVVIPGSLSSSSAVADGGYRHHRHHHHWRAHHRWGDRDYEIIRWSYGDCKIWRDDAGPPTGVCGKDWVVLADRLPTWDAGWARLQRLRARKLCT